MVGVGKAFLVALVLAAPAWADAAVDAAVKAECALLEKAYLATRTAGAQAWSDILVGCPGHESLRATMTKRESKRAFALAARSQVPETASQFGKSGKIVFQRMIARGVPVEVAVALADSAEFAAAVAAVQKL